MNWAVEVNRRSQGEEYLSEHAIRSWKVGVENGSWFLVCVLRWWNVVGIRTRTQGELN